MAGIDDPKLLLGKNTPAPNDYSPQILFPIAREMGRLQLADDSAGHECKGADLWHAYELSWLDAGGRPQAAVGRFTIPASSPNMVESKSFKLYLNSLNQHRFPDQRTLEATLQADLSKVLGAPLGIDILPVDHSELAGLPLIGSSLDAVLIPAIESAPRVTLLTTGEEQVSGEALYTHLFRSLCPVTGQPDFATLWLRYSGAVIDRSGLLQYLLAFRQHQAFHEQCVERIFGDLMATVRPSQLEVQGFYTRRGGLDINPFRSTDTTARPLPRMNRQ